MECIDSSCICGRGSSGSLTTAAAGAEEAKAAGTWDEADSPVDLAAAAAPDEGMRDVLPAPLPRWIRRQFPDPIEIEGDMETLSLGTTITDDELVLEGTSASAVNVLLLVVAAVLITVDNTMGGSNSMGTTWLLFE